ncbi:MAG: clostripain-related cysteine peptidase [Firmicutes bacterium]|nr:clostripain-related cysteine peptidase [Bacillota bacterium]
MSEIKRTDNFNIKFTPPSSLPDKKSNEVLPHTVPQDKAEVAGKKDWTVLVYFDGQNDLRKYAVKNMLDMEKVGSTDKVNLVSQFDTGLRGTRGLPAGASRFYVTKGGGERITSKPLENLGQVDSASPKILKDFLAWGMKKFPARNYLVIVNDHGGGALGAITDRGEESDGQYMPLPPMAKAVRDAEAEAGVNKNNVMAGFDACMMSAAEVGAEFKGAAKYILGSEDSLGENGFSYDDIAKKLNSTGTDVKDPLRDAGEYIVKNQPLDSYNTVTLSLIDEKAAGRLTHAVGELSKAILNNTEDLKVLKETIRKSQRLDQVENGKVYVNFRDLADISKNIAKNSNVKDEKIKEAAARVEKAVIDAVIYERHEGQNLDEVHGMNIYAPLTEKGLHPRGYESFKPSALEFEKESSWFKALKRVIES